jgi:hypothetical protein
MLCIQIVVKRVRYKFEYLSSSPALYPSWIFKDMYVFNSWYSLNALDKKISGNKTVQSQIVWNGRTMVKISQEEV